MSVDQILGITEGYPRSGWAFGFEYGATAQDLAKIKQNCRIINFAACCFPKSGEFAAAVCGEKSLGIDDSAVFQSLTFCGKRKAQVLAVTAGALNVDILGKG